MIAIKYGPDSFLFEDLIEDSDDWFHSVNEEADYLPRNSLTMSIYGKTFPLPRDKAFYCEADENGLIPHYRYTGDYVPVAQPWKHERAVQAVRDLIEKQIGAKCNHVVINRYVDGKDHIGYHTDKTRDFVRGSSVYTVSLGATRTLRLKHISNGGTMDVPMEKGSLFMLGPKTNETYKHFIVKQSANVIKDTRISLTFRQIATRIDAKGNVVESCL